VDAIRSMRCPVLIVSGTRDVHTTVAQTQALFAAANPPRDLWLVPRAAHVDLARHDPRGYAEHVVGFLERSLFGASKTEPLGSLDKEPQQPSVSGEITPVPERRDLPGTT